MHQLVLRGPDGHPLEHGYPVVCCGDCGCGYADVLADPSYYERYYAQLAKYAGEGTAPRPGEDGAPMTGSGPADPRWMTEKADEEAARIALLVPGDATPILDVGCATGSLLGALARRGYTRLVGVDPAPAAVAAAASRPGVSGFVGDAAALPASAGRFGCVCLTGVLEHLFDPAATLRAVRERLEPGGIVYVEVPDAWRYLDPYLAPFEDFNTEHVNHFSLSCLKALGERCGLEVVHTERVEAAIAPQVFTGVCAVAWRETAPAGGESPSLRPSLAYDSELEASLRRFAERSNADLARVDAYLEGRLAGAGEVGLWGVGETAFKLLALDSLRSRKVVVLADGNPARSGLRIGGVAVRPPAELAGYDVPVVVASFLRAGSILQAAASLGLANTLVTLEAWRTV